MSHPIPPPDEASLREAALRHLARYATSVAGLVRILDRRIDRWARDSSAEAQDVAELRRTARAVAARLAGAGAVDDRVFAASRARTLMNTGRSRRAIAAHLAARGTDREAAREALPDDPDAELTSALIALRRRRFGPWGQETDLPTRRREMARLARAGFSESVVRRAMETPLPEAEALIAARRS